MAAKSDNNRFVLDGNLYIDLIQVPIRSHTSASTSLLRRLEAELGATMTSWLKHKSRKARLAKTTEIYGFEEREYDPFKDILTKAEEAQEAERRQCAAMEMCEENEGYGEVLWEGGSNWEEGDIGQTREEVQGILDELERIPEFRPAIVGACDQKDGRGGKNGHEEHIETFEASSGCFEEDEDLLTLFDEFPDFDNQSQRIPSVEQVLEKQLPKAIVGKAIEKQLPKPTLEKAVKTQLPKNFVENAVGRQFPKATVEKAVENELPVEKQPPNSTIQEKQLPKPISEKVLGKQFSRTTVDKVLANQLPKAIVEKTVNKQSSVKHPAPVTKSPGALEDAGPAKRRKTSASSFVSVANTATQPQKTLDKRLSPRLDSSTRPNLVPKSSLTTEIQNSVSKIPVVEIPAPKVPAVTTLEDQVSEAKTMVLVTRVSEAQGSQTQGQIPQARVHKYPKDNNPAKRLKTAVSEFIRTHHTNAQPQKSSNKPTSFRSETSSEPHIVSKLVPTSDTQKIRISIPDTKDVATGFESIRNPQVASVIPTKRGSKPLKSTHKATIKQEQLDFGQQPSLQRTQSTTDAVNEPSNPDWSCGQVREPNRSATVPATGYSLPPPRRLPPYSLANFAVQPPHSFHRPEPSNNDNNSFGHPSGSPQQYWQPAQHSPHGSQRPSASVFPAQPGNFIGPKRPTIFNRYNRPRNQRANYPFTSPGEPTTPPANHQSGSRGSTNQHPSDWRHFNSQHHTSPTPVRTPHGSLRRRGTNRDSSNRDMDSPEVNDTPIPFNFDRTSSRSTYRSTPSRPSSSREVAVINFSSTKVRDEAVSMLKDKIATDAALGELVVEPNTDGITIKVSGPPARNLRGKLAPMFGRHAILISMKT